MTIRLTSAVAAALLLAACGGMRSGDTLPATMEPIGEVRDSRVGTQIGASLSAADLEQAKAAEYRALEYSRSGEPFSWQSKRTDTRGTVEVGQGYLVNRLECRDYTNTIYIGGRAQVARGVACRAPEGTWRIVD